MPGRYKKYDYPDANQKEIVKALQDIPGVDVDINHDDILVGYKGRTFWFEIKNPSTLNKYNEVRESEKKPKQKRLEAEWPGHYRIVTSLDEILEDIDE